MSETQTTAERIAELILRSVEQSIIDFDHVFNADPVAHAIAAEIGALTRERDEARAEIRRRESDLSAARITITELESERNGANAFLDEVAFILRMPPAYMRGVNGWAEAKMDDLAEARAEVERYDSVISNAIAVLTIRSRAAKGEVKA